MKGLETAINTEKDNVLRIDAKIQKLNDEKTAKENERDKAQKEVDSCNSKIDKVDGGRKLWNEHQSALQKQSNVEAKVKTAKNVVNQCKQKRNAAEEKVNKLKEQNE